jgi:hypothetical protein
VSQYQALKSIPLRSNPLSWWNDNHRLFPRLAKLAKKYLCIPATSAPSERAFSSASNIDTRHRNRMDPDLLEQCVLIHHYFCEKRRHEFESSLTTIPQVQL